MVAKVVEGDKMPKRVVALSKAWKTAWKRPDAPGRVPHDLRRTAVRNIVRRGVPEGVAMQPAGHKTRCVVDCYDVISEGDLRTAARSSVVVGDNSGTLGAESLGGRERDQQTANALAEDGVT